MEQRTVAIVAADVSGYARLIERDKAGVLAALAILNSSMIAQVIGAGRIFRRLGDGALFEFATAAEAVHFARELQERVGASTDFVAGGEAIKLRIGIALGSVAFDHGDLHGDCVNIAARLEAMAPNGGICISEDVHDALGSETADYEMLGPRHLKNIARPISVWRWSPPLASASAPPLQAEPRPPNGSQVLDRRVTDLLLDLHMRSARLALSDAFDEILSAPGEGRDLSLEALYQRLGAPLNRARDMLSGIKVRPIDNVELHIKTDQVTTLSTFMSDVFDNARTAYAFRLLPQMSEILHRKTAVAARRNALMALLEEFMLRELLPRIRSLISYAFVENS